MIYIQEEEELSEINVTPFIDIMLVLLIIFMAVTPIITNSIKVELPKSSKQNEEKPKNPIVVYLNEKDEIAINEIIINTDNLALIINEKSKNDKEQIIYFHIDKSVQYDKIIRLMDKIKEQGYTKIALVSQKENAK
ncbi:biopolymer transporter ExbD [Campylobacter sp. US33a]|uniref:ExbD/TolR family protein n=1 Tax=Campylobacter sp. US33a TaxID=2498120 RepID=UPI0010673F5D|nr:biopolymer transporter ExbD [Campylobacter sp. US33a]TEY04603.1 biopolymer transporter ExbD [Campylobacter sp. US33a]